MNVQVDTGLERLFTIGERLSCPISGPHNFIELPVGEHRRPHGLIDDRNACRSSHVNDQSRLCKHMIAAMIAIILIASPGSCVEALLRFYLVLECEVNGKR
jgi:hypothetical protein